jgi:1-acyl-sn-glycerol-3-phosphate acyltransferase
MERFALRFGELANNDPRGKWLQNKLLRGVSYLWVRAAIAQRVLTDGVDEIVGLRPETGVMVVSNHRSFFDQYIMMLACFMAPCPWAQRLSFPVRANFFYDSPLGVMVNAGIAGGAMYPPIYRQAERKGLNDEALDRMVDILKTPGNVVGMHPEGTRGKGPDPYKFLPAQPGVGKLALVAKPTVVPCFILGLGNSIAMDIAQNYGKQARRDNVVIIKFGMPIDYSDLAAEKPRPTLYKKCADRFMKVIGELGEQQKDLRSQVLAGNVSDDDPRWLNNRPISKLYATEAEYR